MRAVKSILNLVPIRIRMSVHCNVVYKMVNGSVGNVYVSESFKGCCPVYPRLTVYPSCKRADTLKESHVIFNIFGLKFHQSSKLELKFHLSSKFRLKFYHQSLKFGLKFHQSQRLGLKFHSLKCALKFHRHTSHILAETLRIYLRLCYFDLLPRHGCV